MTRTEREQIAFALIKLDKAIANLGSRAVDRGAALGAIFDARDIIEEMTAGKKET